MTDLHSPASRRRVGTARRATGAATRSPAAVPGGLTAAHRRARDLLARGRSVVVVGHVHPDADALGSALALGMALRARGVRVQVAFAEPATVPESLRELPGLELVVPVTAVDHRPELLVTVDVGSAERLGSLRTLLDTARQSLVIDHHASNTRFGDHHLVDPAAEATVVLIARLIDDLDVPLDAAIAANLYAGLATDTVAFRYAEARTHQLAARLVAAGARPAEVLRPILDTHPFGWLDMLSRVLGNAVLDPGVGHGVGLVYATIDQVTSAGLRQEELDSVIDLLRTAAEAQVAAVLKQTGPQTWQVSLRAREVRGNGVDVAAVAGALGGGGHVRAAGFTHTGSPGRAVELIVAELDRTTASG
ncbi:DHH family phosphoesterase [Nakamurella leprariae]|uniref:DHH family phosphoesterase n=1 Tax=Nakamurella leprariae TaxID=2803911 RepID=UPI002E292D49|nr:bifunctional oligoribonuclease/PAP phosphatase NrnA [Nakamurella leprariae]